MHSKRPEEAKFRLPLATRGPQKGKLTALSNVDAHAAIASVTEAISAAPHQWAFGIIDEGRVGMTWNITDVEEMGESRVLRRDEP